MNNEMNSDEIREIIDIIYDALLSHPKSYNWNRTGDAFAAILTCVAYEYKIPKKVIQEEFCQAIDIYWEQYEKQDSKEAQD